MFSQRIKHGFNNTIIVSEMLIDSSYATTNTASPTAKPRDLIHTLDFDKLANNVEQIFLLIDIR